VQTHNQVIDHGICPEWQRDDHFLNICLAITCLPSFSAPRMGTEALAFDKSSSRKPTNVTPVQACFLQGLRLHRCPTSPAPTISARRSLDALPLRTRKASRARARHPIRTHRAIAVNKNECAARNLAVKEEQVARHHQPCHHARQRDILKARPLLCRYGADHIPRKAGRLLSKARANKK